ncbi:unnamed protein product [Amaranthus hypochondriacus]
MVEPAKARGPGQPRKNDAQKTASSATQTGGLVTMVETTRVKTSNQHKTTPTGSKTLVDIEVGNNGGQDDDKSVDRPQVQMDATLVNGNLSAQSRSEMVN